MYVRCLMRLDLLIASSLPSFAQEFRGRMEMWGLMRLAFSAARVALSKSGLNKIAMRSFAGESKGGRRLGGYRVREGGRARFGLQVS